MYSLRWNESDIWHTLGDQVVDGFAIEFGDDLLQFLSVSFDTDGGQDLLDVALARGCVATEDSQEVSGHVTHSEIELFCLLNKVLLEISEPEESMGLWTESVSSNHHSRSGERWYGYDHHVNNLKLLDFC